MGERRERERKRKRAGCAGARGGLSFQRAGASRLSTSRPGRPPYRENDCAARPPVNLSLSLFPRTLRAGTAAGAGAGLLGGLALGVANHFSPKFRAALGPSGRAAMVVLPALGVVFLEVSVWEG